MFAFAIWDNDRKELFIARDRLGVKPLYYAKTEDGTLVFASEIRAILESELVPRQLNDAAVLEYLLYQSVYAPRTIVDNIYQLPAGSFGLFRDGNLSIKPYWEIDSSSATEIPTDRESIKRDVRNLFQWSIKSRMVSDVPVGAFLSGGIDSSAVVAMMSEVSDGPINTFSITFGEAEFDESEHSTLIARKFKTEHTSVHLTAKDFLDELPNALKAVDSPSGDGLNTYVVSKHTKRSGMKVALSGLGGDELFAGYHYFKKWLDLKTGLVPSIPRIGRRLAAGVLTATGRSKYQRMADILSAEEIALSAVYPKTRQVMSATRARDLTRNGFFTDRLEEMLGVHAEKIDSFPLLGQLSIAELMGYTQNVLLKDTDQFSMASALEVREPFFDYKLVEYVLRVPDIFKLTATPKSLLVDALGDLLPKSTVDRRKMGFVLPFEKWMRNELREFCAARIDRLAERGLFESDALQRKWSQFQDGSGDVKWSELWHLIVLTEWLENNRF